MKKTTKLVFILLLGLTSINTYSQNDYIKGWVLRLGLNTVDSNGDGGDNAFKNIFSIDEEAFHGVPLKLDIEYRFSRLFAAELNGSMNKWKANEGVIDEIILSEDQNYYAVDAGLKFYYSNLLNIFKNPNSLELYINSGIGYFKVNEGGLSTNIGTGINYWFSDHIGININATAKWAADSTPAIYDSGHMQYSAGISYRFNNKDEDNDGIYDYKDKCPNVAGVKELNGCPEKGSQPNKTSKNNLDSDGDGILNRIDHCPNVAGLIKNNGCPIVDSDGDTIIDSEDNCPNVAGLARRNGCPEVDSDGDGVLDGKDKCPTVSGVLSNNGCPIPKQAIVYETKPTYTTSPTYEATTIAYDSSEIEKLARRIQFNSSRSNFTQETYSILNSIVSFVNRYPNSRFIIKGHTDSDGSEETNKILSQNRANAVKNYLINHGVSEYNLEAVGFGERQPLATNTTSAGREINRRVEIVQID